MLLACMPLGCGSMRLHTGAARTRTGTRLNTLTLSIVEFATTEQARRAQAELRERMFMGRPVFLRPVSRRALVVTSHVH